MSSSAGGAAGKESIHGIGGGVGSGKGVTPPSKNFRPQG